THRRLGGVGVVHVAHGADVAVAAIHRVVLHPGGVVGQGRVGRCRGGRGVDAVVGGLHPIVVAGRKRQCPGEAQCKGQGMGTDHEGVSFSGASSTPRVVPEERPGNGRKAANRPVKGRPAAREGYVRVQVRASASCRCSTKAPMAGASTPPWPSPSNSRKRQSTPAAARRRAKALALSTMWGSPSRTGSRLPPAPAGRSGPTRCSSDPTV